MCRQPLSTFYFFCFNILCAQSENTTIAPVMIAVSFITSLPAPVSSGNPCSPLPKSGTHTSGVVTRKESVPIVMIIASPAPTRPILGEKIPKNVRIPIAMIRMPNPCEKPYVLFSTCH